MFGRGKGRKLVRVSLKIRTFAPLFAFDFNHLIIRFLTH